MMRFNLSSWAIRERSITTYLLVVVLFAGVYSFLKNGRAEDPPFSVNMMVVTTLWPGATVEEMENQVADPLEKRLEEIQYFDYVQSKVQPGRVDMLVSFKDSTPNGISEELFYQVRKRLGDEAKHLPRGVLGPFFLDDFKDVFFTLYALTGDNVPQNQLVDLAEDLRKEIRRLPGVKKVQIIGERTPVIYLDFDQKKMTALGFDQSRVQQEILANTALVSGGFFETDGPRVYLRSSTQPPAADQVERLRQLPLFFNGKAVKLGELATIYRGFQDPPDYLVHDRGREALLLGVVMADGANGLKLEEELLAFEEKLHKRLPVGITVDKITNQADAIHQAVDTFQIKFFAALLVVMVISFISLGLRAGIIVALAVPLTLSLTFALMKLWGINFDRISLGALIIALGLLVDDAIISIEMMLVKMAEGLDKIRAAAYAWTLTAAPMLVGTLVTAAGFLPIGLAESRVGEYAGNIFWVVGIALIASWLVAVIFTPFLGVVLLPDKLPPKMLKNHFDNPLYRAIGRAVAWCIRHKWLVIGITFAIFALAVVGMKTAVQKQFFPNSDRPELLIDVNLPHGSSIKATEKLVSRIEQELLNEKEVRSLSAYVGRGAPRFFLALNPELNNPAYGNIIVVAEDWKARDRLREKMLKRIKQGEYAQARVRVYPLLFGPPVPWPVSFRVLGKDADTLIAIGRRIKHRMMQMPFLLDPNLSWEFQTENLQLQWDLEQLARQGLTKKTVLDQMNAWLHGSVSAQLGENLRTVNALIRGDDQTRLAIDQIGSIPIKTATGQSVPLERLARIAVGTEYPYLERRNRERYVSVNAEIKGHMQPPDATMKVWQSIQDIVQSLPEGYRIEIAGSVEKSSQAQDSLKVNVPLMLLVMTALIMFYVRSFTSLFMVLMTAPLGLIGAVAALVIFNQPFGFVANLGLIALGGILMRNTLILIAQIDENIYKKKMPVGKAVLEATVHRARPVILTALAAIFAFMPLTESTFWGPMAYVLIGGVAVGTFLTIFFLPALYAAWYRVTLDEEPAPA
jgi:multidrug efflux pump subunit AcrB